MDSDPTETTEWRESLDSVVAQSGHQRAREIMLSLLKRSKELHLGVPMVPTTDYLNTMPPRTSPTFPVMKRSNAVTVLGFAGMRPSPCTGRSDRVLRSVVTSRLMRPLQPSMRWATTTSSAVPITPAAGTKCFTRVTHLRECMPEHSWKADSPRTSSMVSVKKNLTPAEGCRLILTRGSCPSSGSSRQCRWVLARSMRSTRLN